MSDSKTNSKPPHPAPPHPADPRLAESLGIAKAAHGIAKAALDAAGKIATGETELPPDYDPDAPDDRMAGEPAAAGLPTSPSQPPAPAPSPGVPVPGFVPPEMDKWRVPVKWAVALLVAGAGTIATAAISGKAIADSAAEAKKTADKAETGATAAAAEAKAATQRLDAGEKLSADHEARLRKVEEATVVVKTQLGAIEKTLADEAEQRRRMDRKLDQILLRVR